MTTNFSAPGRSNRTGKPKLDDAETIILMAAANREDGIAFPVPPSIAAPAQQVARKIKRLMKLSLLQEVPAKLEDGLWRKSDDDRHLTLKITPLAFELLGLDLPETMNPPNTERLKSAGGVGVHAGAPGSKNAPKRMGPGDKGKKVASKRPPKVSRKPQKASKQGQTSKADTLLSLLERSRGASLDELMKASGWQAHSVRGFLSAVVKKKLRLKLMSEEDHKGTRRYRLKPRAKA